MGILPHESFQPCGKESNRNPFKKTRNFEGRNIPNARLYAKHITSHNACSSCVSYSPPSLSPKSHKTTNTNSHKIGVTQTDPTGMSHTATTSVTHTDSKAQGAYILTNLKQHFKTERSTVSPTISHPLRTSTHIYPRQPLVSFVAATTDRVPR